MKLPIAAVLVALCVITTVAVSESQTASNGQDDPETIMPGSTDLDERELQSYGGGGSGGGATLVQGLDPPKSPETMSIMQALKESPFSTFTTMIRKAGFSRMLSDKRSGAVYTVFAGTNAAFEGVPALCLSKLWNRENLKKIMGYHIVQGLISAADIRNLNSLTVQTLAGKPVKIKNGNEITLSSVGGEQSEAAFSEWQTKNGLVHVIEPILQYPGIPMTFKEYAQTEGFSEFLSMVSLASQDGLATECIRSGRTVFMPTNNAVKEFAKQLGASNRNAAGIYNAVDRDDFIDLVKNFFMKGRADEAKMALKASQGKTLRTLATKREKVGFKVDGSKFTALLGKQKDIEVPITSTRVIGIGIVNVVSKVLSTAATREIVDDDDDRRRLRGPTA